MQFDLQVGVGTLVVAKPLDAEVQSVYNMTVQVTDGTNFATAQVHQRLILSTRSLSRTQTNTQTQTHTTKSELNDYCSLLPRALPPQPFPDSCTLAL